MKFRFQQHLSLDRASVFRFHETPDNLQLLMEQWKAFRMIEHDGTIHAGAKMRVAERLGPLWVPMTFEHFLFEPPCRFGERQINGPFRKCEHVHEFIEEAGGTTIIDRLDIELPWWLGGAIATCVFIAPRLRRMFAYRRASYLSLCERGSLAAHPVEEAVERT